MEIHLVDGTYELFRYFYALPSMRDSDGNEVAAAGGVVGSVLGILEDGATHVGVATDHVIESFRNDLWRGYKTGEGIDPELWAQFPLMEEALEALGVVVWAMVEHEADDALASAAAQVGKDDRVERVFICTPDKDLAQCVEGDRIVQVDRRRGVVRGAAEIERKLGVPPASIPDYLALVGDQADGFPGLRGWGAKTAATVLSRYGHLEQIPEDPDSVEVAVRGIPRLISTLTGHWDEVLLFRDLATLRTDAIEIASLDELEWRGSHPELEPLADRLRRPELYERAVALAARKPS